MPTGWPTWESSPVAEAREFDVVIIGGGPGGYAAALYAHNFGLSVALVEKEIAEVTPFTQVLIDMVPNNPVAAMASRRNTHTPANVPRTNEP